MVFKPNVRLRGQLCTIFLRFSIVGLLFLSFLHLHFYLPRNAALNPIKWKWTLDKHAEENENTCASFAGLDRVAIAVKTGATEAAVKIPTLLKTSLRCAPHVHIFSDMEQRIGNIQIHNALDQIPASIKDGNPDFDLYRQQQELRDPERITKKLRTIRHKQYPEELAAWTLDKYKFMYVVEKTWALQPDMDWYLLIDADTYIVQSSLVTWLARLDPSAKAIIGSRSYVLDKPFAHGGSGILLSGAAVRSFTVEHNGTAASWDARFHDACCGDWLLAQAMLEYGIEPVMDSEPTTNGEPPATMMVDAGHWCQPLVTMHHMSPKEMMKVGELELQRPRKSEPLTYEELFRGLRGNKFPGFLKYWDNKAKDEIVPDIRSAKECFEACSMNKNCFQARYNGFECSLGTKGFMLGVKQEPKDENIWESMWNITRIEKWAEAQKPCGKIKFPFES